jgi:hypothetical protein
VTALLVLPPDDRKGSAGCGSRPFPSGQILGHRLVQPLLALRPRDEQIAVNVAEHHRLPNRMGPPGTTLDKQDTSRVGRGGAHLRKQLDGRPGAGFLVGSCDNRRDGAGGYRHLL